MDDTCKCKCKHYGVFPLLSICKKTRRRCGVGSGASQIGIGEICWRNGPSWDRPLNRVYRPDKCKFTCAPKTSVAIPLARTQLGCLVDDYHGFLG